MKYIYGPVNSRRLGFSLGVSLVPHKVCPFDCVYCQLGATTAHTSKRREYVKIEDILSEIKEWLCASDNSSAGLDYITLSGSGEPTLNSKFKMLIDGIKKLTPVPVAVITNSFFLPNKSVRQSLLQADLIIPSLNAVTQDEFEKISRPVKKVRVYEIIKSLISLRHEFKGKIWLEIMLVKGINDSAEYIRYFQPVIARINPEKIQINTPVRCPDLRACVPDAKTVEKIRNILGEKCEVV